MLDDSHLPIDIYFFDSENPDFVDLLEKDDLRCHGYGELFFISEGKIIHSDRGIKTGYRMQEIDCFQFLLL